jgi:hypothetical protein
LRDFPGGRPLAFAVLPALAIQRLPFPAKRNGGGHFVMVSVVGSPRPPGYAVTKGRSPAPALNPAQPTTIPFGRPALSKTPHISEPDSRNVKAKHLLVKRNPGLARARCVERADSLARANYIGKATLPPGQFTGEFQVPFCVTSLAGDPLSLRFFLPSRFSASLFRQNGMVVGLSLWCRLSVPRARQGTR